MYTVRPIDPVVWEMQDYEERYLSILPAVVPLWHVWANSSEVYYLRRGRGIDGQRALAHSQSLVHLERIAVRCEHILAVDLDRQVAQVFKEASI